jgi:hypothetical protein
LRNETPKKEKRKQKKTNPPVTIQKTLMDSNLRIVILSISHLLNVLNLLTYSLSDLMEENAYNPTTIRTLACVSAKIALAAPPTQEKTDAESYLVITYIKQYGVGITSILPNNVIFAIINVTFYDAEV